MRSLGKAKLRKGPKRERKRAVCVKGYCRSKPQRRRRSGRNQRGEAMPF